MTLPRRSTGLATLAAALLAASAAQAAPITYSVNLSGPAESPPNASAGTGSGTITIDTAANLLGLNVGFAGLSGSTTVAHIHCCTATPGSGVAGVATQLPSFAGFPAGVTSGTYVNEFDTSQPGTYNPAFLTSQGGTPEAAEAALAAGLAAGTAYLNIHSNLFPGGEIRGFAASAPASVPEPGPLALLGAALAALVATRRRAGRGDRRATPPGAMR